MIITIEGNIGSGKTTLLQHLANYYEVITEPVEKWLSSGLLQKFYDDPIRHAFEFQKYVVHTMYDRLKQIDDDDHNIYIVERSIMSSLIFSKVLLQEHKLSKPEYEYIYKIVKSLQKPCETIYLRTSAVNCLDRINQRSRDSENKITLQYLDHLEKEHEDLFSDDIIINGNNNQYQVLQDTLRAIEKIKNKIVIQN